MFDLSLVAVVAASVGALFAVWILLDWRRGIYVIAVALPFEALVAAVIPTLVKLVGAASVLGFVGSAALHPRLRRTLSTALRQPTVLWLLAFTAWVAASSLWAQVPGASLVDASTFIFLLAFVVMTACLRKADVFRGCRLFISSAAISVAVAASPILGSQAPRGVRLTVQGEDPNYWALVLLTAASVAAFGLAGRWRLAVVPILTLGILGSSSRGALVAAAAMIVAMLAAASIGWLGRRAGWRILAASGVLLPSVILGLICLLALPAVRLAFQTRVQEVNLATDRTYQQRVKYWRTGGDLFVAHPLAGIGAANFKFANEHASNTRISAHNMWLETAAELGVVGVLLFGGFVVSSLRRAAWVGRAEDLGIGLLAGLLAWCAGGLSLSLSYQKTPFFVVGSVLALHRNRPAPTAGSMLGFGARRRRSDTPMAWVQEGSTSS